MQEPHFPVGLDAFQAKISFVEVTPDQELALDGSVRVTTHRLNHRTRPSATSSRSAPRASPT